MGFMFAFCLFLSVGGVCLFAFCQESADSIPHAIYGYVMGFLMGAIFGSYIFTDLFKIVVGG